MLQMLTSYQIAAAVVQAYVIRTQSNDWEATEASRAAGFPRMCYTKTARECVAEAIGNSPTFRGWEPMLTVLVETDDRLFSDWMKLQIKGE